VLGIPMQVHVSGTRVYCDSRVLPTLGARIRYAGPLTLERDAALVFTARLLVLVIRLARRRKVLHNFNSKVHI
jgi:hypothetical protein